MTQLRIKKVRDVKTPVRGTSGSAGIDFFIPNDAQPIKLYPGEDVLIPSGIVSEFPHKFVFIAAEKSGVATSAQACIKAGRAPKKGAYTTPLIVGAKIVDSDYQGEIHLHIINVGNHFAILHPGMKIQQFLLIPIEYAEVVEVEGELYTEETERGNRGFGHGTGSK